MSGPDVKTRDGKKARWRISWAGPWGTEVSAEANVGRAI